MMILTVTSLKTFASGFFAPPNYRRDLETRVPLSRLFPSLRNDGTYFVYRQGIRAFSACSMMQGGRRGDYPRAGKHYLVQVTRNTGYKYIVAFIDWRSHAIDVVAVYDTKKEALAEAKAIAAKPVDNTV